jgi:hypothetical protein
MEKTYNTYCNQQHTNVWGKYKRRNRRKYLKIWDEKIEQLKDKKST